MQCISRRCIAIHYIGLIILDLEFFFDQWSHWYTVPFNIKLSYTLLLYSLTLLWYSTKWVIAPVKLSKSVKSSILPPQAPRAKMNQQRSRRFRASKETQEKIEEVARIRSELQAKGAYLPPERPKEAHFDSNCITPGTPFMDRLSKCLHYYIHDRWDYLFRGFWGVWYYLRFYYCALYIKVEKLTFEIGWYFLQ